MYHSYPPVRSGNEYGVINAKDNAHLILGNVYQQSAALTSEQKCHQVFKNSPYEDQKDRNPPRVAGTCQWVLNHSQFREWRSSRGNPLLWISADPGCGKSVLSKALVDEGLCCNDSSTSTSTSTVCYFFFKDNEEQDSLATALCALLHQLFSRQPHLLRHAMPVWEKNGDRLGRETGEMWRILQAVAEDPDAGPVVCVLDALDECRDADRRQLIHLLCDLHQSIRHSQSSDSLKVLVTSRPYDSVQRWFEHATSRWPSIRLRGENENDAIHQEINLVIEQQIQNLVDEFSLPINVRDKIRRQLLDMQHRTYLWLYLAMEEIRESCRDSLYPDEIQIISLPVSVDNAYERILGRIQERQKSLARQVLLIIVGARRPLSMSEMALALSAARAAQQKQSSRTPIEPARLERQIREQCGLFVFINHSQLFLIHLTAKEFLVAQSPHLEQPLLRWKSCLHERQIEREMTSICVSYLHLFHQQIPNTTRTTESPQQRAFEDFWQYCAEYWTSHLRDDFLQGDERLLSQALSLFTTNSDLFARWFPIMWKAAEPYDKVQQLRDQHVVAMTGHAFALQKVLEGGDEHALVDAKDSTGRTALLWAVERGHRQVVQLLLERGADVNAEGGVYGTALTAASQGGHEQIVQLLLERGADVNAEGGEYYGTALTAASQGGHEQTVQLLLERGADVNAEGGVYGTALAAASRGGHEQIVQLLLERGAKVNAKGGEYSTAL